jgi:hypothetical protein
MNSEAPNKGELVGLSWRWRGAFVVQERPFTMRIHNPRNQSERIPHIFSGEDQYVDLAVDYCRA